jgi:hypothetical protein
MILLIALLVLVPLAIVALWLAFTLACAVVAIVWEWLPVILAVLACGWLFQACF